MDIDSISECARVSRSEGTQRRWGTNTSDSSTMTISTANANSYSRGPWSVTTRFEEYLKRAGHQAISRLVITDRTDGDFLEPDLECQLRLTLSKSLNTYHSMPTAVKTQ